MTYDATRAGETFCHDATPRRVDDDGYQYRAGDVDRERPGEAEKPAFKYGDDVRLDADPDHATFHQDIDDLHRHKYWCQTEIEGQGEVSRIGESNNDGGSAGAGGHNSLGRRRREEEPESRSGSDNLEGGSGDDQDAADDKPPRKKRYHRHTPQQIQELEALFKECPHPDEKQRLELSKRLSLDIRQVKFWFQNRRT
ncbi:unnamed protein product [Cuscuta campestris]|uniref:Homeobox domain-containing protein n=1 Tax=Cuscuta campestris TaxID=132261 RepID=A0A484LHT8_9ASTE|nr:unnamed protein product [Cuscuta campestris]